MESSVRISEANTNSSYMRKEGRRELRDMRQRIPRRFSIDAHRAVPLARGSAVHTFPSVWAATDPTLRLCGLGTRSRWWWRRRWRYAALGCVPCAT